jgi:hypothetical protein
MLEGTDGCAAGLTTIFWISPRAYAALETFPPPERAKPALLIFEPPQCQRQSQRRLQQNETYDNSDSDPEDINGKYPGDSRKSNKNTFRLYPPEASGISPYIQLQHYLCLSV